MKDPPLPRLPPHRLLFIRAAAVADDRGLLASPAHLLLRRHSLGPSHRYDLLDLKPHLDPPPDAIRLDLPDHLLIPGMVNAHCHLDLTSVGPQPAPSGSNFSDWLDMVRLARPQEADAVAASVLRGIDLSLAGGVVAVGDIAGCLRLGPTLIPWQTLRKSPVLGISFLEFFAIGPGASARLDALEQILAHAGPDRDGLGLQPHAPYSVNLSGYRHAVVLAKRFGLPLSTHLAETLGERQFIGNARGPQRAFLESLGLWSDEELSHIGKGHHPVAHLEPVLRRHPWLLAHVNDCSDQALDILAQTRASVAFCPRAWRYFEFAHSLGPHRYRDMLARGINLCLGTDSIINLPVGTDCSESGRLCVLDEARILHQSDGVEPDSLLRMITSAGAQALGLRTDEFRFSAGGPIAGVVAVRTGKADPLKALFEGNAPPTLINAPGRE